ncbi:MAG: dTMP kinase [Nitrososphaerota archaeon]
MTSHRTAAPFRAFVVDFEGPDGSGKTTVLRKVARELRGMGYAVVTYKTPGPSPTGRFAVEYGNRRGTAPISRMLLFLTNTVEETREMLRRCKRRSADFLLLDRYYLCSIVFGLAYLSRSGIEVSIRVTELVRLFESLSGHHVIRPHLYVVVDVDEEERLRRVRSERGAGFLELDSTFQNLVRQYYADFRKDEGERVLWVVNERDSLEQAVAKVVDEILARSGRVQAR